ncbi:MAG: lytic transglycosylase domain-containing protein [Candidatus Kapaibacterium sp.]
MLILIIFSFILNACSESAEVTGQTSALDKQVGYFSSFSGLKLPDKLSLCGEELPLEDPEIKERAEREFYILLQQPGQIVLYLKRSGRYFPMFERILREKNMPDDLKYLAVAESALYQAKSVKGAVGLWQFMPATAEQMGLIINQYADERRHPEKSTYAALEYLKAGYETSGSWLLTLAGYNMGHSGLARRVEYQFAENYFDLYLNEETSRFIFRIAIIKELMQKAEKYGFNISEDEKYKAYKTETVTWDGAILNLAEWARVRGTNFKALKLANPWILGTSLAKPLYGRVWEIDLPTAR